MVFAIFRQSTVETEIGGMRVVEVFFMSVVAVVLVGVVTVGGAVVFVVGVLLVVVVGVVGDDEVSESYSEEFDEVTGESVGVTGNGFSFFVFGWPPVVARRLPMAGLRGCLLVGWQSGRDD